MKLFFYKKNVNIARDLTYAKQMKPAGINSTIIRTIIYTIGHILIAMSCIIFITGTDIRLATIDAIVEPLINSIWYFILDYLWNMQARKKAVQA